MDFITINGRPLGDASDVVSAVGHVGKKPRATYKDDYPKDRGFVVEGYAPGAVERAKAEAERSGVEWDELTFMRHNKTQRVRSKPYELPDAAEQCAGLARKAGWTHVSVRALVRP